MVETTEKKTAKQLPINQETLDVIVANVIPTSKYFEVRFDHMENRVDRLQDELKDFRLDVGRRFEQVDRRFDEFKQDVDQRFDDLKQDVNLRFEQVDRRFEQVDKRFEQVDYRFEQIDKRFDQVITSIERLTDTLYDRDKDLRTFTMRMFSISIMISFLGVLGVFLKLFQVV